MRLKIDLVSPSNKKIWRVIISPHFLKKS
ncbi:unnamed protein product [Spirodela intermedia]|uniref:Uncharacterized protein n=1 Tax=Spirodela intermedia TaxID=51605 RepID=A0A7I8J9G1_SPIIN|nr:unnamed protein product [Spirodela intermedia]CAA6666710.1 unnamed protein product [Spirodela intermedia]